MQYQTARVVDSHPGGSFPGALQKPLLIALGACAIVGLAPPNESIQAPIESLGIDGNFSLIYQCSVIEQFEISHDGTKRQYALTAHIGHLPKATLSKLLTTVRHATAYLADMGLCLSIDPATDTLALHQSVLAAELHATRQPLTELAKHITILLTTAIAWRHDIDKSFVRTGATRSTMMRQH